MENLHQMCKITYYAHLNLELLQTCDAGSREHTKIASVVEHSLWNSKCGLKVTRVEVVNNEALSSMVFI